MDKNLVAAIAEKNLSHIKSALTSINLKDPNFSTGEFDEALRYVSQQGINLYEPFDGENFKHENDWDKNYWLYINASLEDNFCQERITELKKVGRKLYPAQTQSKPAQSPTTSTTQPRQTNSGAPKTQPRPRRSESSEIPLAVKAVGATVLIGAGCLTIGPPATLAIAALGGAIACLKKRH